MPAHHNFTAETIISGRSKSNQHFRTIGSLFCCVIACTMQVSALLDSSNKEDFVDDICEEYEQIREEHYESMKVGMQV